MKINEVMKAIAFTSFILGFVNLVAITLVYSISIFLPTPDSPIVPTISMSSVYSASVACLLVSIAASQLAKQKE